MIVDRVTIVQTNVANMASVTAAFERLGVQVVSTDDPDQIASARCIVLPGVGSFSAGMQRLRSANLVDALATRIRDRRPTLAICLGLQLLCTNSEESAGIDGLGVVDATVTRFPASCCVPQFGWNEVRPGAKHTLLKPGFAYFANSYRLANVPGSWSVSFADHGGPFVAAIEDGPVLACQFHPELSADWGRELLCRWLARCASEVVPC